MGLSPLAAMMAHNYGISGGNVSLPCESQGMQGTPYNCSIATGSYSNAYNGSIMPNCVTQFSAYNAVPSNAIPQIGYVPPMTTNTGFMNTYGMTPFNVCMNVWKEPCDIVQPTVYNVEQGLKASPDSKISDGRCGPADNALGSLKDAVVEEVSCEIGSTVVDNNGKGPGATSSFLDDPKYPEEMSGGESCHLQKCCPEVKPVGKTEDVIKAAPGASVGESLSLVTLIAKDLVESASHRLVPSHPYSAITTSQKTTSSTSRSSGCMAQYNSGNGGTYL
ncbi:uncharacterized protein LOC121049022 isoform X2 [Rosa chinensis]|nr:uncharacterized protein LOC121049022 isoform X2 [Rosa chinensis]